LDFGVQIAYLANWF